MFTLDSGSGFPLIILHGLLGMSDNWVPVSRKLSAHYRVIVPDLRNHGRSPHSSVHTYEAMAHDVVAFCERQGLAKIHLLGHSMGGKVAMTIACAEPSLVDHLVVADIGPGGYPGNNQHTELLGVMMAVDLQMVVNRQEVDRLLALKVDDQRIRMFLLKNLTRDAGNKLAWRPNLPVLLQQMPHILAGIPPDGLFTGKTLFLKGADSDYLSGEQCNLIYHHFPAARLATIENAGHWLHADDPESFTQQVQWFLQS